MAEMQGRGQSKSRRAAGVALVVAGALVLTTAGSIALAQDPRQGSGPAAAASPGTGTGTPSGGGSDGADGLQSNVGELPFTGLDLLILGGLAMVLLGTGMALRRLSAPRV